MNRKPKSYPFTLKNIDISSLEKKYNLSFNTNLNDENIPNNTTNLTDLSDSKEPKSISFYDEAKKEHKCNIIMIDFLSEKEPSNKYNCFWCRHQIPSSCIPIGCPIKYIPNELNKTYYSEISKEIYSISEQISLLKSLFLSQSKSDSRLSFISQNFYITDGIFCSFNCTLSYIYDKKHDPLYSLSECLLYKIFDSLYPFSHSIIEPAPSFRLLSEYGGYLSISKFRENFNKIIYTDFGTTTNLPSFKSIASLYEETLTII